MLAETAAGVHAAASSSLHHQCACTTMLHLRAGAAGASCIDEVSQSPWKIVKYLLNKEVMGAFKVSSGCQCMPVSNVTSCPNMRHAAHAPRTTCVCVRESLPLAWLPSCCRAGHQRPDAAATTTRNRLLLVPRIVDIGLL